MHSVIVKAEVGGASLLTGRGFMAQSAGAAAAGVTAVVWLVCCLSTPAAAGLVMVAGASGSPLSVEMGAGSTSQPAVLTLINDVAGDPPQDFLSGWQLSLVIVPDGDALGSVTFAAVSQPEGYIFDQTDSFGLNSTNNGDRLLAFDFNSPFTGGVEVPTDPGTNVLSLMFHASGDAFGTFGLFVDPSGSEWTDASQPTQNGRFFSNVPAAGGLVRIGQVVVPKPASGLVLALLAVGLLVGTKSRHPKSP